MKRREGKVSAVYLGRRKDKKRRIVVEIPGVPILTGPWLEKDEAQRDFEVVFDRLAIHLSKWEEVEK